MFKDEMLNQLAEEGMNIAQFVSFAPNGTMRYCRISDFDANKYLNISDGLKTLNTLFYLENLLRKSRDKELNIRTFTETSSKGNPFIFSIRSAGQAFEYVENLTSQGYYVIVNEMIDVNDSGVSGVLISNVCEFSPGDTPRCVEKPGCVQLPLHVAEEIIDIVYDFAAVNLFNNIDTSKYRYEFSVHPVGRGYYGKQYILWEREEYVGGYCLNPKISWPNNFSKLIGDKVFGLLIANSYGCNVPYTQVVGRGFYPFRFGRFLVNKNKNHNWIRTSPVIQVPGKFTTTNKLVDVFSLLNNEDPNNTDIASVLYQSGPIADYSGSLLINNKNDIIIEGVAGSGDDFMVGNLSNQQLPEYVIKSVTDVARKLQSYLDSAVRFEWVFTNSDDSPKVWILQLHVGTVDSYDNIIYPGDMKNAIVFHAKDGLEELRLLISEISGKNIGIIVVGNVGVTSHFGDVLRKAKIPSYLKSE